MMLENIRLQSEQALNHKKLTLPQYRLLVKHYEKALGKYTYCKSQSLRRLVVFRCLNCSLCLLSLLLSFGWSRVHFHLAD
jgi:hypothetical protein